MRKVFLYVPLGVSLFLFACSGNNAQKTVSTTTQSLYVRLPDGSEALLHENSTISYDTVFTVREVNQTGEVFYIVHKTGNPFVVKTPNGEVEVKGTEFNVKADKQNFEVEVEQGSVEMKVDKGVKLISNGQKALFSVNGEGILVGKADFKYKKWTHSLAKECKGLGKQTGKSATKIGKDIGKEPGKLGKEIGGESKKVGKEVGKSFKKLKKELE